MNLSLTAQATLLLTSLFTKANSEDVKPLTNAEWGRFALWLKEKSRMPADLLVSEPHSLLSGWHDPRISIERIVQLLNRGHSLALAVEKWQRAGLWVVTRSDPEYPRRLKQRLKTDSPPVLFGCGNQALLNAGGVAVVGSRNANISDLSYAEQVGFKAATEGAAIVSGGARGVDEAAMLGAMHNGGTVVGVMADSLLKTATSAKWRHGLMEGNVVLVSPFYPEAGFSAGNAMARNKYIYCLADCSLVIHAGQKGGTLNGAQENLKKGWVPLWVKPTEDKSAANSELVGKGGRWCDANIEVFKVSDLLLTDNVGSYRDKAEQADLFSSEAQPALFDFALREPEAIWEPGASQTLAESKPANKVGASVEPVDFYPIFVSELRRLAAMPVTLDELLRSTSLHKSQLSSWLNRAIEDNVIERLNHPVRYQVINSKR
ncbi:MULTISPECIES: DNA-processing protein DprA [unclassified Serratia (in: enterobacteria)]|uniref:DNA-processing protein DprA n=1 Tax=unclassified Serratia (in: enterobacteria) TaxID=2647522 RepID=UPI003075F783